MTEAKHAAANTYTDEEQRDLAREAIARALKVGIEYSPGKFRSVRRAELKDLRDTLDYWEAKVGSANGPARNRARLVRKP